MNLEGESTDRVWRIHSQADFHWRQWGVEWTVFDGGSGQTHLLDPLTALAVMTLEAAPATVAELAAQLFDENDSALRPEAERALGDLLVRLSAADLIEPVER